MTSHSAVEPQMAHHSISHDNKELWREPLDTPGYIPHHMKHSAAVSLPILEVIHRLLFRFQTPVDRSSIERILALIGLYQAVRSVYKYFKAFLVWTFTAQITIPDTDQVAKEILIWMESNVIQDSHARDAMISTSSNQDELVHSVFDQRIISYTSSRNSDISRHNVTCMPSTGSRLFWVGLRPFIFSRRGNENIHSLDNTSGNVIDYNSQLHNSLMLMTLGWSLEPLKAFVQRCHQFKLDSLAETTTVYFAGFSPLDVYGNTWYCVSKAIRKFETIDTEESIKSDIIQDAEYYYSKESQQYFADCGMPYRRGYLFYGPPGTGKSSFSAALAAHLMCDIYHINLASGNLSDGGLHRLFLTLPHKCVVVIEDIDSSGIERELSSSNSDDKSKPPLPDYRPNVVTLNGLLNTIDGNTASEGRLLIITSNNPDALDPALLRPGRIDKKVYFGNMSKSAARSIFKRLIGRYMHNREQIEQFAEEFADKIPADSFTPAQVQGFLQSCRRDPHRVLAGITAWVKSTSKDMNKDGLVQTSQPSRRMTDGCEHAESLQTS